MRWGAVEHMLLDILVDAPSEYDRSTMTLRSVESGFSLVIMGLMTDQGLNRGSRYGQCRAPSLVSLSMYSLIESG